MLTGSPPNNDYQEIVQVIMAVQRHEMEFQLPREVTTNMRNLINSLLRQNSKERPSALEALLHPALQLDCKIDQQSDVNESD